MTRERIIRLVNLLLIVVFMWFVADNVYHSGYYAAVAQCKNLADEAGLPRCEHLPGTELSGFNTCWLWKP